MSFLLSLLLLLLFFVENENKHNVLVNFRISVNLSLAFIRASESHVLNNLF